MSMHKNKNTPCFTCVLVIFLRNFPPRFANLMGEYPTPTPVLLPATYDHDYGG